MGLGGIGVTMIQLHITRTHKTRGDDDYYRYDDDVKNFKDLQEAKAWLKDEYGTCKRSIMYRDDKQGNAKKIGYIYSFKTYPVSYDDKHGYDSHWIAFYKVTELTV